MAAERAATRPGERALTEALGRLFGRRDPRVVIGIGDDAAVLARPPGPIAVCCDPVVEGVHFESRAPAAAIGHKAVVRNLSDLAAMGATPSHLLVSLLVPDSWSKPRLLTLCGGLDAAARAVGSGIVGGDVGRTTGPLTVTVTAIGDLPGRPLQRSAARPGDRLHVTGALGGAGLGRHLRGTARLAEGRWLAADPAVGACIDISDGLSIDLWTLLRASGCAGAELDAAAVPCHDDARRLARRDRRSALDHALGDGEDHELLFTVRAGARLRRGGPLTAVGRLPIGSVVDRPGLWLTGSGGEHCRLSITGYQHRF